MHADGNSILGYIYCINCSLTFNCINISLSLISAFKTLLINTEGINFNLVKIALTNIQLSNKNQLINEQE